MAKFVNYLAIRRDYAAKTGPKACGFERYDKIKDKSGNIYIFIGVCDGVAVIEAEKKAENKDPFIKIESEELSRYSKVN